MVGGVELGLLRQLPEPERTAKAAQQFEAVLVEYLLKTMRQAALTDRESESLSGSDTYLEIADQQLALALVERGGLGIARMILENLTDKSKEGV